MDKEIERKICGILDPTGRTKCPLQSQTDYERGSTCEKCMLFEVIVMFREMANKLEKESKGE